METPQTWQTTGTMAVDDELQFINPRVCEPGNRDIDRGQLRSIRRERTRELKVEQKRKDLKVEKIK